jgi:hypothetical protein
MHWHDGSTKTGGDQVAQDLRPDLAPPTIGADHRDHARFEERTHRCSGLGSHGAVLDEAVGDGKRQNHVKHALFESHGLGQT